MPPQDPTNPNDLSLLAAAFNAATVAAADKSAQAAREDEHVTASLRAERRERALAAEHARAALLEEVAAFAERVDDVRVSRGGDHLILSRDSRAIALQAEGEEAAFTLGGVGEPGDGLAQDATGTWQLTLNQRVLPLVPYGLAALMVTGLGLPRPESLPETPEPVVQHPPRLQTGIAPPRPASGPPKR